MPKRNSTDLDKSGSSFILTRIIEAPQELVWRAWTDPTMLAEWWGPRGYTNRCEVDLRAGGKWRIVMISEAGVELPLHGTFLEVKPIVRLVMQLEVDPEPSAFKDALNAARGQPAGTPLAGPIWVVTLDGTESRTTLRVENRFDSIENRDGHIKLGASEGWSQSFDRLDELLETHR